VTAVGFAGISRRFGGVQALDDVSFSVAAGSCHAVCGENGAGKSTLGKILAGIVRPDRGAISLDGNRVEIGSPRDARAAGIAIVHQELAFCENLTVAENLCLGSLPRRGMFVDRPASRRRAEALLAAIGASVDPDAGMARLSVAEQQLVQIAAAVGEGAKVIVFDEPTSSLDQRDADRLYEVIRDLKARGTTTLYVSHRMPEIFALCDAITVLRDGRHVTTRPAREMSESDVVQAMIGRALSRYLPAHPDRPEGEVFLSVEDLRSPGRFESVSFTVRCREVVGLAGLVGAGRTQVADALFGLDAAAGGKVTVRGQAVRASTPRDAIAMRIGYVPEDRKRLGLVLSMTPPANVTLPSLGRLSWRGWIDRRREAATVQGEYERLQIRGERTAAVSTLSGGNQQKVVVGKWLARDCDLLILDEPTRGVDVGAKAELHAWIDRLACDGKAILLISSELPELIALASRILVMKNGRIVDEQPRGAATQESLMRAMS
jgi:ABC-type sugar transport system ATPase subunit